MARYIVNGYNGPSSDFTATIEVEFDLHNAVSGERRCSDIYNAVKPQLLDSDCPTDYLEVLDWCDFEDRDDLADNDLQIVWLAESMGCDNCQDPDGGGNGSNDWTDGCNDEPHGGYMLTFDKMME